MIYISLIFQQFLNNSVFLISNIINRILIIYLIKLVSLFISMVVHQSQ